MIKTNIGGYRFGRCQITGTFLSGPLAGKTVYFGDTEAARTFAAGDEFKRYSPEFANKTLRYSDYDGGELTGTLQFFQWNQIAQDIYAMAHATPRDQLAAAAGALTVEGKYYDDGVYLLEKVDVIDVIVSDGNSAVYEEGEHYELHNDGKSPAVVSLIPGSKPAGAGVNVEITFGCKAKKLSARYLLNTSKFEMRLVFQDRVKADNPTVPNTLVIEKANVVLDGDVSVANTSADLATVSAKWTAVAVDGKPEGQEYGYVLTVDE